MIGKGGELRSASARAEGSGGGGKRGLLCVGALIGTPRVGSGLLDVDGALDGTTRCWIYRAAREQVW